MKTLLLDAVHTGKAYLRRKKKERGKIENIHYIQEGVNNSYDTNTQQLPHNSNYI